MKHQQGVTLLVTMFGLLALSILGSIAVKQSGGDMGVAMSEKVSDLLFQSTELAMSKIERDSRLRPDTSDPTSFKGYMIRPGKQNEEVIFCLRPQFAQFFGLDEITVRVKDSATDYINSINNGFCDPSQSTDFVRGNGNTVTQVIANQSSIGSSEVFGGELNLTVSNDLEVQGKNSAVENQFVEVTTVSSIPAFASEVGNATSTDSTTVAGCYKQPKSNIKSCLDALGVPNAVHFQRYKYFAIGFNSV